MSCRMCPAHLVLLMQPGPPLLQLPRCPPRARPLSIVRTAPARLSTRLRPAPRLARLARPVRRVRSLSVAASCACARANAASACATANFASTSSSRAITSPAFTASPLCTFNSTIGPPARKLKLAHCSGSTLPEADTTAGSGCADVEASASGMGLTTRGQQGNDQQNGDKVGFFMITSQCDMRFNDRS